MTNDLSRRRQSIIDYYAAVDAGNRAEAMAKLSPKLEFRFANGPAVIGEQAPAAAGSALRRVITGMDHTIEHIRFDTSELFATIELQMTYHRTDGSKLKVPACVVLGFDDSDLIAEYRVYVDASELAAVPS